jgi:hypothetical protein
MPFFPVSFVSKGVPGRGLDDDLGVDASTGILGAGVPRIVTSIVAVLIEGLGEGEIEGEGDAEGTELLWQAAIAKAARARTIIRRLGMVAWSSTPRADAPLTAPQRPK